MQLSVRGIVLTEFQLMDNVFDFILQAIWLRVSSLQRTFVLDILE